MCAPLRFQLCDCKDVTVDKVKSEEIYITFRRWLPVESQTSWDKIWNDVESFQLLQESDNVIRKLGKN